MSDDNHQFTPLAEHIMSHLVEVEGCEVKFTCETAIDVTGPFDIEDLAASILSHIDRSLADSIDETFKNLEQQP